ncbi:MAG: tetratricopeptide repeat protein [Pseudomonas sp.]|uniref:tetratricopeptide repeat protein n=1 Tax=Pseudomonas sp. TaxID=306 RepID=UPI00299EA0A0|nr:tetratricopeptide repeat protein [Pseudomonas sp.]MDX1721867.1 tetratricopeptide repeat protein [Pseudomonas sp.]
MNAQQWLRPTLPALLCTLLLLGGCASQQPSTGSAPQTGSAVAGESPVDETEATLAKLRSQANRGDLDSQFQLGSFYFVGKPAKDLKQAEYWWQQAADKGHAMAAVSLAYLYTGRDNPDFANPQRMLKYLNQSAAGGNPMAQHILGNLYLRGEQGVPRDASQARRLFQSACKQNYAASCTALSTLP